MNGVTILNSYEKLINIGPFVGTIILCVLSAACALSIAIMCLIHEGDWINFILLIVFILGAIVCGCLIPDKKYETYYQVIVDDSVTMNEFQSEYEIIKVEGQIYTVKECIE